MAVIGVLALIVVALVVFAGLIFGLASISDLRRYRRMRSM
jgi:hypothetical protein